MALLFCDSFDHYATGTPTGKLDSAITIGTGQGRGGTNSGQMTGATTKNLNGNYATVIVGAAVKIGSLGGAAVFRLQDSATLHVDLRVTAAGELQVTRNGTQLGISSGAGITAGVYYYIEFKATINDATGSFEARLNGTTHVTGSGADTRNGANAYANQLVINTPGGTSNIDDLYVCDDSGSVNNGFLGDIRVVCVRPNGAGNYSQWTPSAGANYENVDDTTPDSDTTYNSEATAGEKDTYAFGAVGVTGTVKGVQAVAFMRKDDGGARTARMMTRIGGSDYFGGNLSVLDTYKHFLSVWDQSPATSSAWTTTEIDGAEFGVELVS
jgi:hypothetical protein